MNNLTCVICGKPLTGGTDTFGDIGVEMCQVDYWEMMAEWNTFVRLQNIVSVEERREATRTRINHANPPT